jgi:hypothetical protein
VADVVGILLLVSYSLVHFHFTSLWVNAVQISLAQFAAYLTGSDSSVPFYLFFSESYDSGIGLRKDVFSVGKHAI